MTVPSVSRKLRKVKNRSSTAPISAAGCRGRSFIVFLRKATLLTLSALSFTVREAFFSFGPHRHHEPVGRRVATIDLDLARVRPQSGPRDYWGRQRGGRRVASGSRRLSAADRGANSLRRAGARDVSRLCAGAGVQFRHRNRDGAKRTGTRRQAGAGGQRSGWPWRDGGTGERSPA